MALETLVYPPFNHLKRLLVREYFMNSVAVKDLNSITLNSLNDSAVHVCLSSFTVSVQTL